MQEQLDKETKIEVLKFFYSQSKDEIKFLRERQDKIFTWSNNLLVLLIGAILIIDSSKELIWSSLGWGGRAATSVAVVAIVAFSVRWQQRNRIWQEEHKAVANRISQMLFCFEEDYYQIGDETESTSGSLFPRRWNKKDTEYREASKNFWERRFPINNISITYLLGLVTIILLWLPR